MNETAHIKIEIAGLMAELAKNGAPKELMEGLTRAYTEIHAVHIALVAKTQTDLLLQTPKW